MSSSNPSEPAAVRVLEPRFIASCRLCMMSGARGMTGVGLLMLGVGRKEPALVGSDGGG